MGILATLFGKGRQQRLDTGPWQPRLASATLRYMDRKGVHEVETAPYLARLAKEALQDARASLKDDRERGAKKVHRLSGAAGIPSYWHLAYSAGAPLGELSKYVEEFLEQLSYWDEVFAGMDAGADNRIIDVGKNYPGPLLDLAWLVGLGANRSQLERFLPCCGLPGQDALFDRIVQKLGFDRPVADRLRFPGDYQATLSVLDAPPEQQGELLAKVLKRWHATRYPDMPAKDAGSPDFTGEWALDVALLVMLWNIDDTLLRQHASYPAELVDHYRAHRAQGLAG